MINKNKYRDNDYLLHVVSKAILIIPQELIIPTLEVGLTKDIHKHLAKDAITKWLIKEV